MKKIIELIICIVLHPVAVVLAWINVLGRSDITVFTKIIWIVLLLIPVAPIFYIFFSGDLW